MSFHFFVIKGMLVDFRVLRLQMLLCFPFLLCSSPGTGCLESLFLHHTTSWCVLLEGWLLGLPLCLGIRFLGEFHVWGQWGPQKLNLKS